MIEQVAAVLASAAKGLRSRAVELVAGTLAWLALLSALGMGDHPSGVLSALCEFFGLDIRGQMNTFRGWLREPDRVEVLTNMSLLVTAVVLVSLAWVVGRSGPESDRILHEAVRSEDREKGLERLQWHEDYVAGRTGRMCSVLWICIAVLVELNKFNLWPAIATCLALVLAIATIKVSSLRERSREEVKWALPIEGGFLLAHMAVPPLSPILFAYGALTMDSSRLRAKSKT